MIKTKEDLKYYLEEDAKANKAPYKTLKQKINWYINPRLRFTRNLRFYEYYSNRPQNPYNKLMALWHYYIHKKLSYQLGFTIRKKRLRRVYSLAIMEASSLAKKLILVNTVASMWV